MTEKPHQEKAAFIRDGALVLYFDMAEKPVLARFDLDTLAQASFEVSAKDKDGFYTIMLHDFSGEAQAVAQFASKGDAHQTLYAILQALLSQKETTLSNTYGGHCRTGGSLRRFFKEFLKTILYLVIFASLVIAALYVYFIFVMPSATQQNNAAAVTDQQNSADPATSSSVIPEGEALSAEDYLSTLMGDQPAPSAP